ncbi:MAG: Rne/Rng family ribonuclease [Chlamydiia bacterium]
MKDSKEIMVSVDSKETRVARMSQKRLTELSIERKKNRLISGNIYKGKVTNILKNIQSAFIDINEKENGFIHVSDAVQNSQKLQEMFEIDFDFKGEKAVETGDISSHFKVDQYILVQVVKDPIGSKGARLTSNVSIAGRYLVLLPNSPLRGVSRKIKEQPVRNRLKEIIERFELPSKMGLICRTASIKATTDQLIDEVRELIHTFDDLIENYHKAKGPTCLYRESDITKKVLLTAMDKGFERILTDHLATFNELKKLYIKHADHSNLKIEFYRDKTPMFERFGVDKEIEKALKRKLWLQSGAYLFFDRTEAMQTVDVNSGRSTSDLGTKDVEEALVQINKDAAVEIARQLRIRNVGGLIVIDFIDMRSRKNQKRVLETLKEALMDDSAKCTVLGMSEFGLVEMTRQRNKESLIQTLMCPCPYCGGQGTIQSHETASIELERAIKKLVMDGVKGSVEVTVHPELDRYLDGDDKDFLDKLTKKEAIKLIFKTSPELHLNDFHLVTPKGTTCANKR